MKFLFKKTPTSYLILLKRHLNLINYSININLKKNYNLIVKKK